MRGEIVVPDGAIRLRPAQQEDEEFLFDLFRSYSVGVLKLGLLPDAKIEQLVTSQYGSRRRRFHERFPKARRSVLEFSGTPMGELVVDDGVDSVCVVDIALRPEFQRRGIGSALIRWLASTVGKRGMCAMVLMTNAASLGMFRRLGFVDAGHDTGHIELRWRPLHEVESGSDSGARPFRGGDA